MTGRENVECAAREAGWELKAIGVGDASDDLVRVFRAVPHRSAVLSFSKSGDLFYADGVEIGRAHV